MATLEPRLEVKKILFTTDFSEASHQGFEYLYRFAGDLQASIDLLHVYYESPVNLSYIPMDFVVALKEEKMERAMHYFQEYLREAQLVGGNPVDIRPILKNGATDAEIIAAGHEYQVDLIAMTTMGEQSDLTRPLGSYTAQVMAKTRLPLLILPTAIKYRPIKHILYAAGLDSKDLQVVEFLRGLCESLNAKLTCLYVGNDSEAYDKEESEVLEKLFKLASDYNPIELSLIHANDVLQGVERYLSDHNIDLTVMLTHYRNIQGRLHSPSLTRKMAMQTEQPLLVLQADQF